MNFDEFGFHPSEGSIEVDCVCGDCYTYRQFTKAETLKLITLLLEYIGYENLYEP